MNDPTGTGKLVVAHKEHLKSAANAQQPSSKGTRVDEQFTL
jgi:hypothetical protein